MWWLRKYFSETVVCQTTVLQFLILFSGLRAKILPFTEIVEDGDSFRVTGPLCGEFTGHRWISLIKASDTELWCFLLSAPEQTVEWAIGTLVIWDATTLIPPRYQLTSMKYKRSYDTICFLFVKQLCSLRNTQYNRYQQIAHHPELKSFPFFILWLSKISASKKIRYIFGITSFLIGWPKTENDSAKRARPKIKNWPRWRCRQCCR